MSDQLLHQANDIRGLDLDPQTRCAHYHSALDIVAIKMKCCGVYYGCKIATSRWPATQSQFGRTRNGTTTQSCAATAKGN